MGSSLSAETCFSGTNDKDGHSYWASFDSSSYFAEGACRWAFKGTLHGIGRPRDGDACVIKVFKKSVAKYFDSWVPDLAVLGKAQKFADHFHLKHGAMIRNNVDHYRQIEFQHALIAKMDKDNGCWDNVAGYVKPQEYVLLERYLDGNYEKFNSNGGYENQALSVLLPAFTHWTFEESGHTFMICDLQGVKRSNDYLLTDPVVHSLEQLYTSTGVDLGIVGMEMVMARHKCNFVCNHLRLPKSSVPYAEGKKCSTYDFELSFEDRERAKRGVSPYIKPSACPTIYEE